MFCVNFLYLPTPKTLFYWVKSRINLLNKHICSSFSTRPPKAYIIQPAYLKQICVDEKHSSLGKRGEIFIPIKRYTFVNGLKTLHNIFI